ncbi:DUF1217 domain-containing protein [Shimia aestuarii]|uniref:Flagellar protein n=1 Tax=Shimia aestuarii TaxID=254406 RepID=A0A1I4K900_9RHOB|nr:DUF1217 domain-containing protein [Shimia aestuarii]SFL75053.1 Protein of unknown function [Shimia aestuarii]
MSFQPVVAGSGLAGWAFLKRTLPAQTDTFNTSPMLQRDTAYFSENIRKIESAEQLVADRRLLRVALGAFGLDADIDNRFFIQKILEEGTLKSDALANKLADSRYSKLSKAFGFGDFATPSTKISDFGEKIVSAYRARQFEIAVGNQEDTMRLAMNAIRELEEVSSTGRSDDAKWYSVMGSPPLRKVMETALGLPASFAQLDLDKQKEEFRDRLNSAFGDGEISQFTSEAAREKLVERYLVMSQLDTGQSMNGGQIALTLLQF